MFSLFFPTAFTCSRGSVLGGAVELPPPGASLRKVCTTYKLIIMATDCVSDERQTFIMRPKAAWKARKQLCGGKQKNLTAEQNLVMLLLLLLLLQYCLSLANSFMRFLSCNTNEIRLPSSLHSLRQGHVTTASNATQAESHLSASTMTASVHNEALLTKANVYAIPWYFENPIILFIVWLCRCQYVGWSQVTLWCSTWTGTRAPKFKCQIWYKQKSGVSSFLF